MARPKRSLPDVFGLPIQGLSLPVPALTEQACREIMQCLSCFGMLRTQMLFPQAERLLIQEFRLLLFPLGGVDGGQTIEGVCYGGMFTSEGLSRNLHCLQVEWLGLRIPALAVALDPRR